MKTFLFLLLAFSSIYAQVWNNHIVNNGQINTNQALLYDNQNNPIVFYNNGGAMFFSKYTSNGWTSILIAPPGNQNNQIYAFKVDTLIYVYNLDYGVDNFSHTLYQKKLTMDGVLLSDTTLFSDMINSKPLIAANSNYVIFCYCYNYYNSRQFVMRRLDISNKILTPKIVFDDYNGGGGSCIIDANNFAWISYYGYQANLKMAKIGLDNFPFTWVVDTEGDVGSVSQIWVENNTIPHIAYYDATNKRLKYATLNP